MVWPFQLSKPLLLFPWLQPPFAFVSPQLRFPSSIPIPGQALVVRLLQQIWHLPKFEFAAQPTTEYFLVKKGLLDQHHRHQLIRFEPSTGQLILD